MEKSLPYTKIELHLPSQLVGHLEALASLQGISTEQAITDLIQEDRLAWENAGKQEIIRKILR